MSAPILDTNDRALEAGQWYALGIRNDEGEIEWGGAPLYRYDGEGCWSDDDGEPVDRLWDAPLQVYVAMDAADAYMRQSS